MINNKKAQKRFIAQMFMNNAKKYLAPKSDEMENNIKDQKIMESNKNEIIEQEYSVKISDSNGSEKDIKIKSNLTFDEAVKIAETNLLNEALSKMAFLQLQDKLINNDEIIQKVKDGLTLFPVLMDLANELETARKDNADMLEQIRSMKKALKEHFNIDESNFESEVQ